MHHREYSYNPKIINNNNIIQSQFMRDHDDTKRATTDATINALTLVIMETSQLSYQTSCDDDGVLMLKIISVVTNVKTLTYRN